MYNNKTLDFGKKLRTSWKSVETRSLAKYSCRENCLDKGLLRTKPGFYWKANREGALFDITSTGNNNIHTLPCITTLDSKLWCFHYKILHNTLHINENLFLVHKHNTLLCSFCNLEDEQVIQLEWLWCIYSNWVL